MRLPLGFPHEFARCRIPSYPSAFHHSQQPVPHHLSSITVWSFEGNWLESGPINFRVKVLCVFFWGMVLFCAHLQSTKLFSTYFIFVIQTFSTDQGVGQQVTTHSKPKISRTRFGRSGRRLTGASVRGLFLQWICHVHGPSASIAPEGKEGYPTGGPNLNPPPVGYARRPPSPPPAVQETGLKAVTAD